MDLNVQNALYLSAALFSIGIFGVLSRRNLLIVLMSVEIMLNGANLAIVAISRDQAIDPSKFAPESGQALVLFSMAVAAAEVAVGLSILIALFRHARSVDTARATALRR
jgi:NADH:ubiquinone oxidoreductase subunit K